MLINSMNPEYYHELLNHMRSLSWEQRKLTDEIYHQTSLALKAAHPNPLNKYSSRGFSQNQEDGITIEILNRLGLTIGTYLEMGVGGGIENNTLILAALGWQGFWLGGEALSWAYRPTDQWRFYQSWVNLKTLDGLVAQGFGDLGITALDLISVDLDGIDIYLVKHLLAQNIRPRVWIVEYNAHFPIPVEFQIKYADDFQWAGDDYMGSSLQSYINLMKTYGYTLVCCDAEAGANAWFVRDEDMSLFPDVPKDPRQIYSAPRFFNHHQLARHPRSIKTAQQVLGQLPD